MAPLTGALALAALLALPGLAGAAPTTASEAGEPVEAAPAPGAASAARWRAPGAPAEDDWDDLDAAAKAEASTDPVTPRPVRPVRPEAAPRPARTAPPEEPSPVKALAKSALAWLHEVAPWAFSDAESGDAADGRTTQREIVVTGDMLTGAGHESIAPDPLHRVAGGATPAQPTAVAAGPGHAPPDARRVAWGTTGDLLQEAIALVREVAQHPMTWLLIALAVLGRLAIWLLARPVRRARVHRRRRRRHHR